MVVVGNQQPFTASINGLSNSAVNWSVSGTGCTAAQCGTVNSSGLYTAPASVPNPAAVTVTATSQVDNTVTGTATVTVIAQLGVSISPTGTPSSPLHVALGGTQIFNAQLVGDTQNLGVQWVLVCSSDHETGSFRDCAGSPNDDGEHDISTLTSISLTSATFQAAVGDGGFCDESTLNCFLTLTATTNATENGNPATAVVYISVP